MNDAAQRALKAKMNLESLKEQFPFFIDGKREGQVVGETIRLRESIFDLCELLDVALNDERRARIGSMELSELDVLRTKLKTLRRWPDE